MSNDTVNARPRKYGKRKKGYPENSDICSADIGHSVLPRPIILDGEKLPDDNSGGVYDAAQMDTVKIYVGKLCGGV